MRSISSARITLLILLFYVGAKGQLVEEYHDQAGITHIYEQRIFNGGGVAFFDLNKDGYDDLYITGGNAQDHLYLNNGDGTFIDITAAAGLFRTFDYYTTGVNIGDFDNDGLDDIYVTTIFSSTEQFGKNLLFHNQGNNSFREVWGETTSLDKAWSMGAALLDYDLDGDLDIYTINYIDESKVIKDDNDDLIGFDHSCFANRFYRNDGNLEFREIGKRLGLNDTGCALAVTATDYDNDGDVDIILANDFGAFIEPNRIFRNEISTEGLFVEEGLEKMGDLEIYAMGIAIGDLDNDLDFDYYISNLGRNVLLRNDTEIFSDVTNTDIEGNVFSIEDSLLAVSWGTNLFDIDNDKDLDLYVANGYVPSSALLPTGFDDKDQLYLNEGDFIFQKDTSYEKMANKIAARGTAISDFDNDGDLDFFTVNFDRPSTIANPSSILYRNIYSGDNNWLKISLQGLKSNPNAYGAKALLYAGEETFIREVSGGSSHCSHNSPTIHFGLGDIEFVDSIQILWPGNVRQQSVYNISPNQLLSITEDTTSQDVITSIIDDVSYNTEVYPNPANTYITISSEVSGKITVYDIHGRIVLRAESRANNGSHVCDVSDLTNGIYYVHLSNGPQSDLAIFAVIH